MTDRGCLNCEYLIPGCVDEQCVTTTRNTGIALYAIASYFENPQQQYLDCDLCIEGRFVEKGTAGIPTKCTHCAAKWNGCSYCGETGGRCEVCYQTHLNEGTFEEPCVKCDRFIAGCLKCVNRETCTLKKPKRLLDPEPEFYPEFEL